MKSLRDAGLDTVFLAAPTSTERRLKLVAEYSSGFVYLVSRTGVTGERADISDALELLVNKMRTVTNLPLAGGFGISTTRTSSNGRENGGRCSGWQRDCAAD